MALSEKEHVNLQTRHTKKIKVLESTVLPNLTNRYKKIIYILYVNIFLLWMLNIHLVHITRYLPDSLYYIKNLSVYYWLGVILIMIVFILIIYAEKKSTIKTGELIYFLLIIFTVLYLHGTTPFIYTNPRTLDVFGYIYKIDLVGNALFITDPMYFNQFEGSTLMFSTIFQCSKINSLLFAKYYPIYLMTIISLFIYVIAKKTCNKYYIVAPFVGLSLGWIQEYHLSPQSHALILASVLFYLFILYLKQNPNDWPAVFLNSNDWPVILLIIVTWSALCISHALTPILIIVSLIFTCGLNKLLEKIDNSKNELNTIISPKNAKLYKFLGPFIIIYIISFLRSSVAIEGVFSVITSIQSNWIMGNTLKLVDRSVSNPSLSYLFGYNLRMTIVLFTIISGFICLFIVYSMKRNIYYDIYLGGTYLGYLIFGMSLIIMGYNTYAFDRCYMLLLIPYSVMCSMLLDINTYNKRYIKKIALYSKIFIILFTLSSIILLPITQNASDPYNFVSESESAGKNFCFKFNGNILDDPLLCDPINQVYPTSTEYSFYTFFYNFIELKTQRGSEYINKINSVNTIYNSGQYKTSQVSLSKQESYETL